MKPAMVAGAFSGVLLMGLAFAHPFGDPRTATPKGRDTLLVNAGMPAETRRVLIQKCADCHSNETRWPAYARVAPGSWLVERDIVEARRRMNLSEWEHMTGDARTVAVGRILYEARSGEMPPIQYRLLHWNAGLTAGDVESLLLLAGTSEAAEVPVPETSAAAASAGDAVRGKLVFENRCTGCHAMEGDREGPRMSGVFGRKAGSVPHYDYSAGLKNAGVTWDEAALERWLRDPEAMVPDTKMDFRVPKAQERSDLIAYLKHSSAAN